MNRASLKFAVNINNRVWALEMVEFDPSVEPMES